MPDGPSRSGDWQPLDTIRKDKTLYDDLGYEVGIQDVDYYPYEIPESALGDNPDEYFRGLTLDVEQQPAIDYLSNTSNAYRNKRTTAEENWDISDFYNYDLEWKPDRTVEKSFEDSFTISLGLSGRTPEGALTIDPSSPKVSQKVDGIIDEYTRHQWDYPALTSTGEARDDFVDLSSTSYIAYKDVQLNSPSSFCPANSLSRFKNIYSNDIEENTMYFDPTFADVEP